jgi:heme exporter protein C
VNGLLKSILDPTERGHRALGAVALVLVLASLVAIFVQAPTERHLGDVQRIFYFHVACAWTAFLSFFLVFVSSLAYLRTRKAAWDMVAVSAAEIGVVFTSIALLTGSVWAKHAWGTWWEWEPRLTTTLLLWLIYVAYLMLRTAIPEASRRATFSAVFGIAGFVDVPIVFMSIRWWRSIHPAVVTGKGMDLDVAMYPAFFLSLAAFSLFFVYLMVLRTGLERSHQQLEEMRQRAVFDLRGEVSRG